MKLPHLKGYIASALVPHDESLGINEPEYIRHLKEISQAEGLCGVYVNALVGQIYSLEPEEQLRVITLARQTLPQSVLVITGVEGHRLSEIVRKANEAREAGADMLEVLPPFDVRPFRRLASKAEVPFQFFKELAREVKMPMAIFKYPVEVGLSYPLDTLVRIADEIEQVVAMKATCFTCADYYQLWTKLKGKLSIFVTGGDTVDMLGQMMIGADGAQAGIMAIGRVHWARFIALSLEGRYTEARNLYMDKLAPLSDHIYGVASRGHAHRTGSTTALIKEALVALGAFSSGRVRPPDLDATDEERRELRALLRRLKLTPE